MPSLSVVIVAHDSRSTLGPTLRALGEQLAAGDELIVVDNGSSDGTPAAVRDASPGATVIETGANLGFPAACNRGAEAAACELLCLLNPDAVPQPGWREAIERPAAENRGWAAWQALVTSDNGRTINTRGGVVHFTGIAWAGDEPQTEPGFVSGACLVLARERYLELGGMPGEFFLYHEDVDLSLRLRLTGGRLGVADDARVEHDYEFAKGKHKWRLLERNRWATVIRTYPGALLALIFPALLASELALVFVAAAGGWLPQKLRAWGATIVALPRLLAQRREIQARRTVSAAEFARALTPELGSAYLGAAGRSRPLAAVLRAYWRVVLRLLGDA